MDFRRFGVRHGPSEERLGAILRKSWRRLGPSWLHLEPELSETCPETILETSLAVFESKKPCEATGRPPENLCLAMNGKRALINNTSEHVVLVSSPLSVLSSFSLHCYSIASSRSAWHCMPALRALRSLRSLARFARSGMLTVWAPL